MKLTIERNRSRTPAVSSVGMLTAQLFRMRRPKDSPVGKVGSGRVGKERWAGRQPRKPEYRNTGLALTSLLALLLTLAPGAVLWSRLPERKYQPVKFTFTPFKYLTGAVLPVVPAGAVFRIAVAADMRNFAGSGAYNSAQYFRGALLALQSAGGADALFIPGDMDPVSGVAWTVEEVLGMSFPWYPVVGNHELPGAGAESTSGANMDILRGFATGAVNPGPAGCPTTTYSFDHRGVHFIVLNEYCASGSDTSGFGDISDDLYTWLQADLSASKASIKMVIGHEPAFPQPDMDNGRVRHMGDSLDMYPQNRDRFWNLLVERQVTAYVCGHTHDFSVVGVSGVWQVDAGHARGLGDTGSASTFVVFQVFGGQVSFQAYRDDSAGGAYTLAHAGVLRTAVFLPVLGRR